MCYIKEIYVSENSLYRTPILREKVKTIITEIIQVEEEMTSVRSPSFSSLPKSANMNDKYIQLLDRKDRLLVKLHKAEIEYGQVKRGADMVISLIEDDTRREIVRNHLIAGGSYTLISQMTGLSRRQVIRQFKRGLNEIRRKLNEIE